MGIMERKIIKLSGGFVITIPKTLTEIHNLKKGMTIQMKETEEGLLILYPNRKEKN
jgi:antitoxin component of MazEF toxin-antitoxin module